MVSYIEITIKRSPYNTRIKGAPATTCLGTVTKRFKENRIFSNSHTRRRNIVLYIYPVQKELHKMRNLLLIVENYYLPKIIMDKIVKYKNIYSTKIPTNFQRVRDVDPI